MASETETSSPDPTKYLLWGGYIRAVISALGGIGIGVGILANVSPGQWSMLLEAGAPFIGLAMTGAVALWSRWQKFQQARLDHAGNVASARAGKAIKVVSQDGVPPV
jgi:hypothetical protein